MVKSQWLSWFSIACAPLGFVLIFKPAHLSPYMQFLATPLAWALGVVLSLIALFAGGKQAKWLAACGLVSNIVAFPIYFVLALLSYTAH